MLGATLRRTYTQNFALVVTVCDLHPGARAAARGTGTKQAACPFEEVLRQGHLDRYAESHSEDFVAHAENHEAALEEDIAAERAERKALPDMRVTVNQMVAEKDLVAVYWTAVGINTQAGMGFPQPAKGSKLMA